MSDITQMSDIELTTELRLAFWKSPDGISSTASPAHWDAAFERVAAYVRTLVPPAPKPVARVPVPPFTVASDDTLIVPLSDGAIVVWRGPGGWRELPPIPQPEPAPTKFGFPPANTRLTPAQEAAQDRDRLDAMVAETMEAAAPVGDPVRDAAPELLAAVRECAEYFQGVVERESDAADGAHLPMSVEHIRLLRLCDAAIAKAKGRAP